MGNDRSIKKSTINGTIQKKDKNLLFWSIILVFMLILLAFSITYAYFARNVNINGEDPDTVVETGKLDIDFATDEYISNTNAGLINDKDAYLEADKTVFSVKRSTLNTVEYVYYTLELVDINITENLKSEYLKWRLYETSNVTSNTEILSEGDFTNLNCSIDDQGNETCNISLYDTKIPLAKNVTDEFTLLLWLSNDDNKNQNELLKGTISAKVQVTAVNN